MQLLPLRKLRSMIVVVGDRRSSEIILIRYFGAQIWFLHKRALKTPEERPWSFVRD